MNDLPELNDIFLSPEPLFSEGKGNIDGKLEIQVSKTPNQWIDARFESIAIGGIGIHVFLPIQTELTAEELNNIKLRFIKRNENGINVIKTLVALVRWQETSPSSGLLKVGLHFGTESNSEELLKLLKTLKKQKNSN